MGRVRTAHVQRRRWLRRAALATVAVSSSYLLGWLTGWYDGRLAQPASDLANVIAAGVGTGLALAAARRLGGTDRRAWLLVGLGMSCWVVAEAIYGWYDLVLADAVPFPGPADLAYLLGYAIIGAALLAWPSAPSRSSSRFRWVVDGLLLTGALLIISWMIVLQPSLASADGSGTVTLVVGLAYPVGDVMLIALALSCLSRARLGGQLAVRMLVLAVLLTAIADSAYLVAELGSGYTEGTPIGLLWVLCYLLIGMAGLAYDPEVAPDSDAPLRGLGLALPYVAFAATMPFIVWQQWHGGRLDAMTVALAVSCTLGVCLRQWLTSRDNAALAVALTGRQDQLQELAFHDSLTGLPNRALLSDRIAQALAGRIPQLRAVLLLDLDGFKEVNDTYGHAAGDELLIAVAGRIRHCVRPEDTVARMGGDEFAVVLTGPPAAADPDAVAPLAVAQRICTDVRGGYRCSFGEVFMSASIGVAMGRATPGATPAGATGPAFGAAFGSRRDPAAELIRNADLAMYQAKRNGGSRAWVYESELHDAVVRRLALESDLRLAGERGELWVAYQPVVSLVSGVVVAVEALTRWDHPTRGSVSPVEFIPAAESSGLLAEMDVWLLSESCRQLVSWRGAGYPLSLAVNTSIRQVQSGGLLSTVTAALAETGLPAGALTVEITENVLLDDPDKAVAVLDQLRALGVSVALDDFGTGYSSLSYLARLPVDRIKIDRSFIAELGAEPRMGVLVETVVWMGQRLGLDIVAEGVETEAQVRLLEGMGCTLAQGYYYSPAVDAADLTAYLQLSRVTPAQRHGPNAGPAVPRPAVLGST